MALDEMTAQLCKETVDTLTPVAASVKRPIRISPRRMRALILASQQRMTLQFQTSSGVVNVQVVEDDNAPDLLAATLDACADDEPSHPISVGTEADTRSAS